MSLFVPCLTRHLRGSKLESITLGHPLLDDYLAFVAVRARTNTWLAVASDLKIFFAVAGKSPAEVTAADVFAFLAASGLRAWVSGWCGCKTESRAWLPARSPGGCRACAACMPTWPPGATRA